MKKQLLSLFLLTVTSFAFAQNLVPNPDFELIMNPLCFVYSSNISANVNSWASSSDGSPDLLTDNGLSPTCQMSATGGGAYWGMQQPHSGQSMLGVITYCTGCASETREYVQAQLTSPLTVGQFYRVSAWVSFADYSGFFTNNLGILLSVNSWYWPSWVSVPFTPQVMESSVVYDSSGWYQITGTVFADSAYDYISFGNFMTDAQTTFISNPNAIQSLWGVYFLDDVEVVPLTVTALFTADHHVCPGTCTDFTNLSVNATTYLWDFPGGTPSTSTDVNPTVCYSTPGSYGVSLIASNVSSSDTTFLPNYITVYPYSPSQSILQSGDTLISNTGFVSYQWFYQGDTIPGATDNFYVATQSGDYSMVCLDSNGCSVEAVIQNVIASLQSPVFSLQSTAIYPNPVTDRITIHNARFTMGTALELTIWNSLGEKIMETEFRDQLTVNTEKYPAGVYYLKIESDDGSVRKKFVKE